MVAIIKAFSLAEAEFPDVDAAPTLEMLTQFPASSKVKLNDPVELFIEVVVVGLAGSCLLVLIWLVDVHADNIKAMVMVIAAFIYSPFERNEQLIAAWGIKMDAYSRISGLNANLPLRQILSRYAKFGFAARIRSHVIEAQNNANLYGCLLCNSGRSTYSRVLAALAEQQAVVPQRFASLRSVLCGFAQLAQGISW